MDKKYILVGMIIALVAGGGTYLIDSALDKDYDLYECYAKDPAVAMLCWKLSNPNINNISSRCYWNISSSRRYKQCSTGWIKAELIDITGEPTILPDYESFQIKYDFTDKQEAEDYITNLKQGTTYDWVITEIQQQPLRHIRSFWNSENN